MAIAMSTVSVQYLELLFFLQILYRIYQTLHQWWQEDQDVGSLLENKPYVHPKSTGMEMNRYLVTGTFGADEIYE